MSGLSIKDIMLNEYETLLRIEKQFVSMNSGYKIEGMPIETETNIILIYKKENGEKIERVIIYVSKEDKENIKIQIPYALKENNNIIMPIYFNEIECSDSKMYINFMHNKNI